MTSIAVTSFSASGAELYGRRCVKHFLAHCQVPLIVYVDPPLMTVSGRVEVRSTSAIPGWTETAARLPMRRADATRPDYYAWHARRFAIKPFVWLDAAERLGSGILTWLDGDTQARADIPLTFFEYLLGDADVAYLGRKRMHPETGYVGFRIPEALPALRWCRDAYASGAFRAWNDGWTDCHALRASLLETGVKGRDLTSAHYVGVSHIWPASPLAPFLTHYKGRKKHMVGAW